VIVGRKAGRLDDENILAADILEDFDEDLVVRKAPDVGLDQRQRQARRDGFRQRSVAVAGENLHESRPLAPGGITLSR